MEKRLQTVLAHAGVASRRHAAELIESGKVQVDGRSVTEKGFRIDPQKHEILVNGRPIPTEEKKYYFLFNKPKNVISTVSDTRGRKKVTDFFKDINARLYPVGRLDKDTTGIIVITNDGEMAHKLAHPRFQTEKAYRVDVEPCVSIEDIRRIERGIELDGKVTAPCRIKLLNKSKERAVYRVHLREGRKRQIRRMFEAVGARVMELKRVRYAGLTLGRLQEGEFRNLTEKEVDSLKGLR
ncbi:MAG: pseudouridine synthase [Candidatus Omnitrophota bacterium]